MDPHVVLTAAEMHELQRAVVPVTDAVFHLTGSGVADCLQGILTNDVIKPGTNSLVWGAVLTPKGMIISDVWVRRHGAEAWVIVPEAAHTTLQQLFTHSFPPRLATARDVSATLAVRWIVGGAPEALADADLVRPHGPAPFTAMLLTSDPVRDEARLQDGGWHLVAANRADALKLLSGWPTLGREIDDKTLPQEVRFDELDGVRYDKGCYTGQETVARLHFRGHANRILRGVRWSDEQRPKAAVVTHETRVVGTLSTLARLRGEWLGLAMLRHELNVGDPVVAGGASATIATLPFDALESTLA